MAFEITDISGKVITDNCLTQSEAEKLAESLAEKDRGFSYFVGNIKFRYPDHPDDFDNLPDYLLDYQLHGEK